MAENDFQVELSQSSSNAHTGPFTLKNLSATYLSASRLMAVDITGYDHRAFVITIKGRPIAGKTYTLGANPVTDPATVHYLEIEIRNPDDRRQRRTIRRKWSSTSGKLTVTAASANSFTFQVHEATMSSARQTDNLANGAFNVTLRCLVTGISAR